MAYVNVVFNNPALEIIRDLPRARVRMKDGKFQFRPTTRSSDLSLPPGERLLTIVHTDKRVYFSVKEDILVANRTVALEDIPYGWWALNYTDGETRSAPSAKLVPAVTSTKKRSKKTAKPLDESDEHVNMP